MRKFKRHQPRSLRFRLLLVVAGALLLMAAVAPRANASAVIAYFNILKIRSGHLTPLAWGPMRLALETGPCHEFESRNWHRWHSVSRRPYHSRGAGAAI